MSRDIELSQLHNRRSTFGGIMSTRDDNFSQDDNQLITVVDNRTPGSSSSRGAAAADVDDGAPFASERNILQCSMCEEPPMDPISTTCGDVFCWPCMHQWLQDDGPKPCPVCEHTLRRDLDIIPLFGGGALGTSAGTTTTRENTSDIPPRPSNPLLLPASPTPDNTSGSSQNRNFVLPPNSMVSAHERSIHQLSESLDAEQVRTMSLSIDCIDLGVEVSQLEQWHTHFRRALRHGEWVLGEEVARRGLRVRALEELNEKLIREAQEGRAREKRHVKRGKQMEELIARLQQKLEVAVRQLNCHSGGERGGSVQEEISLHEETR